MNKEIIKTTLGDLIAALSDEMGQATNRRQEDYNVVAYLLADLLHKRSGRFKARNYEAIESMREINHALSWQ
ncbi:MAG TPA: hypothetical protein VNT76_04305 [Candidatus Binatus sp.]|nr:hypothetical protein [Candidatus Binatus sp.]